MKLLEHSLCHFGQMMISQTMLLGGLEGWVAMITRIMLCPWTMHIICILWVNMYVYKWVLASTESQFRLDWRSVTHPPLKPAMGSSLPTLLARNVTLDLPLYELLNCLLLLTVHSLPMSCELNHLLSMGRHFHVAGKVVICPVCLLHCT